VKAFEKFPGEFEIMDAIDKQCAAANAVNEEPYWFICPECERWRSKWEWDGGPICRDCKELNDPRHYSSRSERA
jgi:hypothetical protein